MFEKALMMYIYGETPMHPGSGAVVNSPVDLPIQREKHTMFPIIQGSSLKGVLRSSAKDFGLNGDENNNEIKRIFGPEKGDEGAGGLSVSDARILAYPVRSLYGSFGWVTCPMVLSRYKRDLGMAGILAEWEVPSVKEQEAICQKDSNIVNNNSIYLEDFMLTARSQSDNEKKILESIVMGIANDKAYSYIIEKIKKDTVIVNDTIFNYLVQYTTEVSARIKINQEKGTVEPQALFYEEYLPTDTIMYALLMCTNRIPKEDLSKLMNFDDKVIQIGGNETIGRGFARVKVVQNDKKP